jgi:hypothetical protein
MIDRIDSSLGREFILSAEKVLAEFAAFWLQENTAQSV